MFYTTDQWIERVKADMEELTPDWDAIVSRIGDSDIELYIRAKWNEALTRQLLCAPETVCPVKDAAATLVAQPRQDGSGCVVLPDDMLRMVRFEMKGWSRPVIHFIDATHLDSHLQHNPYARGGTAKPTAVISSDGLGHIVLEYYSLPPGIRHHYIKQALYIAIPHEIEGGYDLSPVLGQSVCYLCAALVYEILGRHEAAATMNSRVLFHEKQL